MALFKNRIEISLILILLAAYFWEFHAKPVSGPIYTAAVDEYKKNDYRKSLHLLLRAYDINPNDTGVLTLMGWDYLKLGKPGLALEKFSRAHRLAPKTSDAILGYAETEIELGRLPYRNFDQSRTRRPHLYAVHRSRAFLPRDDVCCATGGTGFQPPLDRFLL